VDEILARYDHDPREMLGILADVQTAYGHLPVAAMKHISSSTGAWYAQMYGTATFYQHLRFDPPVERVGICRCTSCLLSGAGRIQEALERGLETQLGQPPTSGAIRLEQLPTHPDGVASPAVTVDGRPQDVTPESAEGWARGLAGGASVGGTDAAPDATSAPKPRRTQA
jgi:NADH:ubiquinone oxidoreductase subunit E